MELFAIPGIVEAAAGAGAAILTLFGAVITSKNFRESVIRRLSASIKGTEIILFDELGNHDLIIKLRLYKTTSQFKMLDGITDPRKLMLFRTYINLLCDAILVEIVQFTDRNVLDYSDQKLKNEILMALSRAEGSFDKQLHEHLISLNNDNKAVKAIVTKLSTWRYDHMTIMLENCESVVTSNGPKVTAYTVATMFSVVMTGIDYLKKNGLESFNRLNGELDSFIDKIEP